MSLPSAEPSGAGELALTGSGTRGRALGARVGAWARAPAVWVAAIVCVSAVVRAAIGLGVPSPWIFPDELLYSDLAKSIAAGGEPAVRGVPTLGWGVVYPTLVAPAWALFDDPVSAYHAALAINALVMSSAAIPAYLLARMFVTRRASVLVAAATVLVPSMAYTGVVMTENACYPLFLLALLLVARAVRQPTAVHQVAALVALGAVALTRIQAAALVGAYAAAVAIYAVTAPRAGRSAYLRRFAPSVLAVSAACAAPLLVSIARGQGAFGWLGGRSGTFDGLRLGEVPRWLAYLTADLLLYVAVVPAAATAVAIGLGLSRRGSEPARLFSALALSTLGAVLVSVSVVSASIDVDGTENLNERYVFYVVPLLFVGLASWIEAGMPRPKRWAWVVLGACSLLVVALPVDRLRYNARFQSFALLPWIDVGLSGLLLVAATGAVALACGLLWATSRRGREGWLWLLTGAAMTVVGILSVGSNRVTAEQFAQAFEGRSAGWVDEAVPAGAEVVAVWDQRGRPVARGSGDALDFAVMVTEVFNHRVGRVYRLGPPSYYESVLPTVPTRALADGTLADASGRPLAVEYALVTCRAPVRGEAIVGAARGGVELIRVEGPLRLAAARPCGSV